MTLEVTGYVRAKFAAQSGAKVTAVSRFQKIQQLTAERGGALYDFGIVEDGKSR